MKIGSCMKFLNCICGVDAKAEALALSEQGPKLSPQEEAVAAAKFLDEDQFWKRFCF